MTSPAAPAAIRTPDQRLRVFVSSTMRELADERDAVREAIAALRLTPVLFELGARPHPPRDLYRAYLEQSDIFVGIYGREYGWVAPEMDVSGIEDEYLLSAAKPRLIYVKDLPDRDSRLRAMLDRMGASGGVSYKRYATPKELANLVADDIALLIAERFQPLGTERLEPRPRCDLPAYPTAVIGRERETQEIASLLARDDARLVTLTGPGGMGKTRLAVIAAHAACEGFADGARFAGLQGVRHAARVSAAIATALDVQEAGQMEPADALERHLRDRRMLIVVDNFEQVIAAGTLLARLLRAAPAIKFLVTSREPLQIYGEYEYPVAALEVPRADDAGDALAARVAVQLFVERARAVRSDFALTADNAADVREICARLDGIPLAIELAANRIRTLTPAAIRQRLGKRLDALSGGARDLPERQQTMRAAIAWSHDLLDERERALFARCGVFTDGFLAPAAEDIAAAGGGIGGDALDIVSSLVTRSLLRAGISARGEPRFSMLELIREFALEQLDQRGETAAIRAAHARHYTAVAAEWNDAEVVGQSEVMHRYWDEEYGNLREALAWTLDHLDEMGEEALERLLGTKYFYWYVAGRLSEGREWSERALAAAGEGRPLARAAALQSLGAMAMWQGDLATARTCGEEAVAAHRALGRAERLPYSLMLLGITALHQGDTDASESALLEAVDLFRARDQVLTTAICLMHLANVASERGDIERAREYLREGLGVQRTYGEEWSVGWFLSNLGELARLQDDHAAATAHYREALPMFESANVTGDVTRTRYALGYCALRAGDIAASRALFADALDRYAKMANRRGIAECLLAFGSLAVAEGDAARAAALFGAADAAMSAAGAGQWPADAHERERDLAALRPLLDAEALDAALARGRGLSEDEAVALCAPSHGS